MSIQQIDFIGHSEQPAPARARVCRYGDNSWTKV